MNRLFRLTALIGLLCLPAVIEAQYQVIELADVQLAKSVGATIQDPTGDPVPKAVVQEFSADWKTGLRSSSTDAQGKFSFTPAPGRTMSGATMKASPSLQGSASKSVIFPKMNPPPPHH